MKNPKIFIELVPKTCWFSNVRSQVSSKDWDFLRKKAYKEANFCCSVCKRKSKLEAHEIWHYNDSTKTQKLYDIIAVCKSCHELYHLGFTSIQGKLPKAINWLAKLNDWTKAETEEYINIVFEIWYQRSQKQWILDLNFLDKNNIEYNKGDIIQKSFTKTWSKKGSVMRTNEKVGLTEYKQFELAKEMNLIPLSSTFDEFSNNRKNPVKFIESDDRLNKSIIKNRDLIELAYRNGLTKDEYDVSVETQETVIRFIMRLRDKTREEIEKELKDIRAGG